LDNQLEILKSNIEIQKNVLENMSKQELISQLFANEMELPNFSVDPIKLHHENTLFSQMPQIA
jgi:hypothetical protein